MSARQWVLEDRGERPLTVNALVNMHRMSWAAHTQGIRRLWWGLTKEAKIPALDACTVTVQPLHATNRSPQDVAACAPHAKAAIDGIVDAGVLPDDDATHLVAVTFLPPLRDCGIDGLRITVAEVEL